MIEGSCHCGAVRWEYDRVPDGATACNCTVCRRYGVLWAYDHENEGIRVFGNTRAYVRGKALEFHFDGFDTFDDLPRDGRCVADYWF